MQMARFEAGRQELPADSLMNPLDTANDLQKLDLPVLFIHDSDEADVPTAEMIKAQEYCSSPLKSCVIIDGATNHIRETGRYFQEVVLLRHAVAGGGCALPTGCFDMRDLPDIECRSDAAESNSVTEAWAA
eukprot:NODE_17480_length_940_cov_4.729397.p1 GENE.NODE_17480_length_940_cov_4.729397~~NODE_17480_length_940_cov_4.729397.p1  ORF type:complete len:131 (+),score=34.24 NODE_17480_length_940_cov_4.729397:394-786(+)